MSALEDFLLDVDVDDQGDAECSERPAFRVHDDGSAQWALRKLAVIRRRQADARALADAEISRVTEWLQGEESRLEADAAYFEGALTAWHRQLLDDDPRRKTVRLPAGTLTARQGGDRWTFDDDFLDWAEAHHRTDLLRVKVEVDKPAAKKALEVYGTGVSDEEGEVVPGVSVEPGEVRFAVQVTL